MHATVAAAGRRLLMDLGSAAFNSSLGWFLERYGALGVEFDEIWAWEVKAQEPQQYWERVPSRVKSRMHVSGAGLRLPAQPPRLLSSLWPAVPRVNWLECWFTHPRAHRSALPAGWVCYYAKP
jgi:hypothetical protein